MIKEKNELKSMFTQHWDYMTIFTACKLDLFEQIQEHQSDLNELAAKGGFKTEILQVFVEVLIQQGFLHGAKDKLSLTSKGELLTESHPDSLKYACLNWGQEHLIAWQNLDYTLKTGKQAFKKVYGSSFFDYISLDQKRLHDYHKAMHEYAKDDYANICEVHNFDAHRSIMDVGGGLGALIEQIRLKNKCLCCYLFEKPEVIDLLVDDELNVKGDFFVTIPKIAEAIIMSRVLHDWNDDQAVNILMQVFQALPENGTLYIIENLSDRIENQASILSLNMYAVTGGFERNLQEYTQLLESAGFQLRQTKKVNHLQYLLIATK